MQAWKKKTNARFGTFQDSTCFGSVYFWNNEWNGDLAGSSITELPKLPISSYFIYFNSELNIKFGSKELEIVTTEEFRNFADRSLLFSKYGVINSTIFATKVSTWRRVFYSTRSYRFRRKEKEKKRKKEWVFLVTSDKIVIFVIVLEM